MVQGTIAPEPVIKTTHHDRNLWGRKLLVASEKQGRIKRDKNAFKGPHDLPTGVKVYVNQLFFTGCFSSSEFREILNF